jgi:hypothetical protein
MNITIGIGMSLPLRFDPVSLGLPSRQAQPLGSTLPFRALIAPEPEPLRRRRRIWELDPHLHCSVIGTCLTPAELRRALGKVRGVPPDASDHELHKEGVKLAGRHDKPAKLLHKALDQRHQLVLRQFEPAATEDELVELWRAAVGRGEIPGAYWALLTHPRAAHAAVREAFGEVHMLSHLVGAANRADIKRLCRLESENAALAAKAARQERQLRDTIRERDARIGELGRALARRVAETPIEPGGDSDEIAALRHLVGDLEHRLSREAARRERAEQRVARTETEMARERELRREAEAGAQRLETELAAFDSDIANALDAGSPNQAEEPALPDLGGVSLLYVGGRPGAMPHLRALGEKAGAVFLHHDGGVEERGGLLAGLISRADLVLFPVDCVSHEAAAAIKRLCRQAGKPFRALRSSGYSSFLAALAATPAR